MKKEQDMNHYLYIVFDEGNDYYIGRRSSLAEPCMDKYMGSYSDKEFYPKVKKIIAMCDSLEDLKARERKLIRNHIGHPKNRNRMIPPLNDKIGGPFSWYNNGKKNIQIREEAVPEGFVPGRVNPFGKRHPTEGTKQWVKNGEVRRSLECPGEGWVQGSYYNGSQNLRPDANKGWFWVTNELESKMIPPGSEIPEGWRKGRTMK